MRRWLILVCTAIVFMGHAPTRAHAGEGLSPRPARTIESLFFTIKIAEQVSADEVALRLTLPPALRMMIPVPEASPGPGTLAATVDDLFQVVSSLLDIRLPSFHSTITICRDRQALCAVGKRCYGSDMPVVAFYVVQENTIYLDAERISSGILAHEMSHAIQLAYFHIPPPVKVQEVLSTYVAYEVARTTSAVKK